MAHDFEKYTQKGPARNHLGRGQLTLIEHALCPLDSRTSLVPNLVHDASYSFTDANRHRRQAKVRVHGASGLSAHDEFYLWGLLALTLSQKTPDPDFHATPHYCLRWLGVIDPKSSRGGNQYRQFAKAVERLSLVRYQADCFYDPIRGEHRKVSFGFFSYNLPIDPDSNRAWRISWDRVFFELASAARGSLCFDLETYRDMDPASRRLFLFLSKLFHRCASTPRMSLRSLAVDVLGFSSNLADRDLKAKLSRCILQLAERGIVRLGLGDAFRRADKTEWIVVLNRGAYFEQGRPRSFVTVEPPVNDPLRRIGFTENMIGWLHRTFSPPILREWSDITLAAEERHGRSFFRKNACAYFLDNVKAAAQGHRTPPDWWLALRKQEQHEPPRKSDQRRQKSRRPPPGDANRPQGAFEMIREHIFGVFLAAGQPEGLAKHNSERFAREAMQHPDPDGFVTSLRKKIG